VKLRSSSTPDIVNGRLSFQKELLGLKSRMVSSGKAHHENMCSGLAPKADLRSARSRECVRALALFLFPVGLSGYTGTIGFLLWRQPRGADLSALPAALGPLRGLPQVFLNVPCRNPHDMDRVADHVGGTLFTVGTSRHLAPPHMPGTHHPQPYPMVP
jgi:hypothetical protein